MSLNIGLAWMAFVNLFPLGIVQLYYAVDTGYWYARSVEFLNLPWVNVLVRIESIPGIRSRDRARKVRSLRKSTAA